MAKKKVEEMSAIISWCKENGANYADFQQMETLGYLKVMNSMGNHYIKVKEPRLIDIFLGKTH